MKAIVTIGIAVMAVGSLSLASYFPDFGGFTLLTAAAIAVLKK